MSDGLMGKTLLVCGSPRKGNTEYLLSYLYDNLDADKELILLKDKDIKMCQGCDSCNKEGVCVIMDDMPSILDQLKGAETLVFASPNYFSNVTGLMKNFIDRTNPLCFQNDPLKDKKAVLMIVGEQDIGCQKTAIIALREFAAAHKIKVIKEILVPNNNVEIAQKELLDVI